MRSKFTLTLLLLFSFFMVAEALPFQTAKTNAPIDTMKIVFFGSSVPFGFGAVNNFGYTYMYNRILQQRAEQGTGKKWTTVNKSIGGDNTLRLMKRWHRDFVSQHGKYVLIALSLGNEGLHERGKVMYDQFKENLPKLIAMARDSGYTPVVTNCYTRNDFNEKDYYYTKQMDIWIHTLDVPTVNLLGAIDDGTGKWAAGYWYNDGHPNDAGHLELAYSIVPSLFDALSNGKPMPKWVDGSSLSLKQSNKGDVDFKPENIVHPFTTTIDVKADGKGQIIRLKDSLGNVDSLTITAKGVVKYKSLHDQIVGKTKITDGKWHKITLTHFYARSETALYCDSTFQGHIDERVVLKELSLAGKNDNNIEVKNWLFYRSGMNLDEVKAMANNTFLRSSLELYAPLDDKHTVLKDVLTNLAQSTNTLSRVRE